MTGFRGVRTPNLWRDFFRTTKLLLLRNKSSTDLKAAPPENDLTNLEKVGVILATQIDSAICPDVYTPFGRILPVVYLEIDKT